MLKNYWEKWNMKDKIKKVADSIKNNRKKIVLGLMCVFYICGWISVIHPAENTVNAKFLSDHTTILTGVRKNDVVRYEMKLSFNWLEEIRLRVSNILEHVDGKVQIEIYPVSGDGEHCFLEKGLSELKEQEDIVFKVEKEWNPGTYNVDIRAIDVPDKISSEACLFQLRMSAEKNKEADYIWINGEEREINKMKIAAGGIVKEKTYTFDFLLLAGFAFLIWALMDAKEKGKAENENK